MNEYQIECHGCDDEMVVICGSDIPTFCPLCGSDDLVIIKRETAFEDWDEDDSEEDEE